MVAFSTIIAIAPVATTMQPAAAQSDAAVGAAFGAIVASLLFDSNRKQYYYVRGGRHVYVNQNDARRYYQQRDPGYYRSHQRDFDRHDGRFSQNWQHAHHR